MMISETDKAEENGLIASDFSMNVKGGRCEECQGTGYKKIELTYLPDSYIICPKCGGRRFNDLVLKAKYKGYSINDVLDATILDIAYIFKDSPNVYSKMQFMLEIGLGYVKLGQMSMNLSGGESQRIKLAKALGNGGISAENLYILDEPTSGLNEKDIERFERILNELRDQGNTILIIEHNLEFVLKNAEYLIDFGCYGGDQGGKVVAQGSVEQVFRNSKSSWNYLLQEK